VSGNRPMSALTLVVSALLLFICMNLSSKRTDVFSELQNLLATHGDLVKCTNAMKKII